MKRPTVRSFPRGNLIWFHWDEFKMLFSISQQAIFPRELFVDGP